jgi:hypothetical protein
MRQADDSRCLPVDFDKMEVAGGPSQPGGAPRGGVAIARSTSVRVCAWV